MDNYAETLNEGIAIYKQIGATGDGELSAWVDGKIVVVASRQQALVKLQEAMDIDPNQSEAYKHAAIVLGDLNCLENKAYIQSYILKNEVDQAKIYIDKAIMINPNQVELYYIKLYLLNGKNGKFHERSQGDKSAAGTCYEKIFQLLNNKKNGDRQQYFSQIAENQANDSNKPFKEAVFIKELPKLMEGFDVDGMIENFRKTVKNYGAPESQWQENNLNESIKNCQFLRSNYLNKISPEFWDLDINELDFLLGSLQQMMGRTDEAIESYALVIKRNDGRYINKATFGTAQLLYDKASQLNSQARFQESKLYNKQSLVLLDVVSKDYLNDVEYFYLRGNNHNDLKEHDKALYFFNEALKKGVPENFDMKKYQNMKADIEIKIYYLNQEVAKSMTVMGNNIIVGNDNQATQGIGMAAQIGDIHGQNQGSTEGLNVSPYRKETQTRLTIRILKIIVKYLSQPRQYMTIHYSTNLIE